MTEYGAFCFGRHELIDLRESLVGEAIPCIICLHTKSGDVCVDCGRVV